MPHEWVNYKPLRAEVSFIEILHHYGVELKERGEQWQGFCPLPTHEGKRNSPSFSANVGRGIWHCFGCGALDFELQRLDYSHPYLRERGFTEETVKAFGLGYCERGLMKGRIAIPLHDAKGALIGYAGRIVDEEAIGKDTPRYLFPGSRERNGTRHEFRKSAFLYNGCRVENPALRCATAVR